MEHTRRHTYAQKEAFTTLGQLIKIINKSYVDVGR